MGAAVSVDRKCRWRCGYCCSRSESMDGRMGNVIVVAIARVQPVAGRERPTSGNIAAGCGDVVGGDCGYDGGCGWPKKLKSRRGEAIGVVGFVEDTCLRQKNGPNVWLLRQKSTGKILSPVVTMVALVAMVGTV